MAVNPMKSRKLPFMLLSCIPWTFLALYGDAVCGWGWHYVLIFLGMAVIAWAGAEKTGMLLAGNGLSLGISLLLVHLTGFSGENAYFKPFGAFGWTIVLAVGAWLVQWLVIKRQWLILGLLTAFAGVVLAGAYWLQITM